MARITLTLTLLLAFTLAAPAGAATDEARLAAHGHTALASFPSACSQVSVRLHADLALRAAYPSTYRGVLGMATDADPSRAEPCTVWLRSGLTRTMFRYTLFHEAAHVAGWQHGRPMDRAVGRALRAASSAAR